MLQPTLSPSKFDIDYIPCVDSATATQGNINSVGATVVVPDSGAAGSFWRITAFADITATSATGNITVTITGTTFAGGIVTTATAALTSFSRVVATATFFATANTTVSYSTTVASGDGNQRYALSCIAEKLSP